MSEPTELYSLLIPLRSERLLVSRMCIADVIPFTDTDREDIAGAPSWLIGSVDWNGRRLPVVSFDTAQSAESMIARRRGTRSRVVRMISISSCFATAFRVSLPRMSSSRDCALRSSRSRRKYWSGSVMRHRAKRSTEM